MCVVSFVMDEYIKKWDRPIAPTPPYPIYVSSATNITQEEVDWLRILIARAKEYDRLHHEPDCELESKKARLRELAAAEGLEIDFLE